MFNTGILDLPDVHHLLSKPRDLNVDEFSLLCYYVLGSSLVKFGEHTLTCNKTLAAARQVDIASSVSDVRRLIKANSLSIGHRKITNIDDTLTPDDFFETGYDGAKWSTIRNGKKIFEIVFIKFDDNQYPDDPWFGETYDEWKITMNLE